LQLPNSWRTKSCVPSPDRHCDRAVRLGDFPFMLKQREIASEQLASLADSGYVFAIVDSCSNGSSPGQKIRELGEGRAVSLVRGTSMEEYYAVAPYLVNVDRQLMEWISAHWDESWGVYVVTKANREEVAGHLHRFLLVLLPDNYKWFFRYYDPRILQAYLATCASTELQEFFGPVRAFAIADTKEQRALLFEHTSAPGEDFRSCKPHASGLWPIRLEQFHALSKASKEYFVQQVAAHVREFFPEVCSRMSQSELEQFIHHGMARAALYGINAEQHACQYVDPMFGFGPNFDQEHRWAAEILTDRSISLSSEKLERLYAAARRHEVAKGAVDV